MKPLNEWTETEIEHARKLMGEMRDRVDARRLIEGDSTDNFVIIPDEWTIHVFKYRTSNSAILLTVDHSTSGRWAYSVRDDWVAFEDEADMTMFMLAYIEPDFKPARLV